MAVAAHTSRPNLAAALTSALVVLVIVGTAMLVAYRLGREAGTAIQATGGQTPETVMREQAERTPGLSDVVAWMDRAGMDINVEARKIIAGYLTSVSGLLQGSLAALVQAAVALYVLFHLLRDRAMFVGGVRHLLPLTRAESDRVFQSFTDSVHANLYAAVITSAINGVTGGALFAFLGMPSPTLWGVVIFVLSIVPVLGTFVVWVPAAAYMALTQNWVGAGLLVTWGILSAIVVDTFLHVRLAGGRMRIHSVPVFIAFLGGLALFGASGVILGPAALAVTVAMMEVWNRRVANAPDSLADESPAITPVSPMQR